MLSSSTRCPPGTTLAQAFEGSAEPLVMARLEEHLASCALCRSEWKAMSEVSTLAEELAPIPMRDADRVRRAILRSTETRSERRRPFAYALVPVAVALAIVVLGRGSDRPIDPQPRALARLDVKRPARFHQTRQLEEGIHREVVALEDGRVRFDVEKLRTDERFVVRVGGDEVEVRGTAFDVDAQDGALREVVVHEGAVAVRARGVETILRAGDRWPPVEIAPRKSPPPSRPKRALARSEPRGELDFDRGWRAMKEEDFRTAAVAFEKASEGGPLAEDAAFWCAVALEKASSADEARAAFRRFLDRFDGSDRRGEASVMLGWLELDAGHPETARELFEAGRTDVRPDVRASAQAGLDAL